MIKSLLAAVGFVALSSAALAGPAVPTQDPNRVNVAERCNAWLDDARGKAGNAGAEVRELIFESYRQCLASGVRQERLEKALVAEQLAASQSLSEARLASTRAAKKRASCHFYGVGASGTRNRVCLTPSL